MTQTTARPDTPPGTTPPVSRWRRRAPIVVPFGLVLLLFIITGICYVVVEPDTGDENFLSPVSTAPIGARQLADRLRDRGIAVERHTRTTDALVSAYRGGATLFVPVPAVVHPAYLEMFAVLPAGSRIVLVDPAARTLRAAGIPLRAGPRRWTSKATTPDSPAVQCGLAVARDAGVATALRQRYDPEPSADGPGRPVARCYDDGLAGLAWRSIDLVVIGAADPFRNDRIDEHQNSALATGLLAGSRRVVWLDLHQPEPRPDQGDAATEGPAPPPGSEPARPGDGSGTGTDTGRPEPGDGSGNPGQGSSGDSGNGGDPAAQADPGNPLWNAFPTWFWLLLAQLALALLVVALWRARRLGPPAAEPLPVTVRAAETVLGRAQLYRRAQARGPAADILRAAALDRIVPLLGLAPNPAPTDVVTAVAGQLGVPAADVAALLYGPAPENDRELLDLARQLDALSYPLASSRHPAGDTTYQPDKGDNR